MSIVLSTGSVIEKNVSLSPLTSWTVGGEADYFLMPKSIDDLKAGVKWGVENHLPMTILGGGTNVLISDQGVRGLTICLRKFSGVTIHEDPTRLRLTCLAGTSKSELLKNFLKFRLEPALFLAGLPGDVGGGVVMNAGVGEKMKPREFTEITDWIEVLRWNEEAEFEIVKLQANELNWSYRHCEGWRPGVITRVGISWPLEQKDDVLARVKQANQLRLSKQPLDMPSCGSVFVNPEGHTSGQLIESCGLKGTSIGGAKVSEKHANFIVNFNSATAKDIHQLIQLVQARVKSVKGVDLRTEVVYVGDWTQTRLVEGPKS